jgi:hypothetical protein
MGTLADRAVDVVALNTARDGTDTCPERVVVAVLADNGSADAAAVREALAEAVATDRLVREDGGYRLTVDG